MIFKLLIFYILIIVTNQQNLCVDLAPGPCARSGDVCTPIGATDYNCTCSIQGFSGKNCTVYINPKQWVLSTHNRPKLPGIIDCVTGRGSPDSEVGSVINETIGNVSKIDIYETTFCALTEDGRIYMAMSSTVDGKPNNTVGFLPNDIYVNVAAGVRYCVGLRLNGSLNLIRSDEIQAINSIEAETQVNADTGTYIQVCSGSHHVVGLMANGELRGWGQNSYGQINFPVGQVFNWIQCRVSYTCAWTVEGKEYCFGQNVPVYIPRSDVPIPELELSTGMYGDLAVKNGGQWVVFGSNQGGLSNHYLDPEVHYIHAFSSNYYIVEWNNGTFSGYGARSNLIVPDIEAWGKSIQRIQCGNDDCCAIMKSTIPSCQQVPEPLMFCNGEGSCGGQDNSTCECINLYNGSECEQDLCNATCAIDSKCMRHPNDTTTCCPGFSGLDCEIDVCETESECINGGTCTRYQNGTRSCDCLLGFSGETCEIDVCQTQPTCVNNATCVRGEGVRTCSCTTGYYNDTCSLNYCSPDPCQNGGTCDALASDYQCNCPEGYTGKNCSVPVCFGLAGVIARSCGVGMCIEKDSCNCNSTFTQHTGPNCEIFSCFSVDSKDDNVCGARGICAQHDTCRCRDPYYGDRCQYKIESDSEAYGSGILVGLEDVNGFPNLFEADESPVLYKRIFAGGVNANRKFCLEDTNSTLSCYGGIENPPIPLTGMVKDVVLCEWHANVLLKNGSIFWWYSGKGIESGIFGEGITSISHLATESRQLIATTNNGSVYLGSDCVIDDTSQIWQLRYVQFEVISNAPEGVDQALLFDPNIGIEKIYPTTLSKGIGAMWSITTTNKLALMAVFQQGQFLVVEVSIRDWINIVKMTEIAQGTFLFEGLARVNNTVMYCVNTIYLQEHILDAPVGCTPLSEDLIRVDGSDSQRYGELQQGFFEDSDSQPVFFEDSDSKPGFFKNSFDVDSLFQSEFFGGPGEFTLNLDIQTYTFQNGSMKEVWPLSLEPFAPPLNFFGEVEPTEYSFLIEGGISRPVFTGDGFIYLKHEYTCNPINGTNTNIGSEQICNGRGQCTLSGNYSCVCDDPEYTQETECKSTECDKIACLNGGHSCSFGICECTIGYMGNDCSEIDYCGPNPCKNGGACTRGTERPICDCSDDFGGDLCETALYKCNGVLADEPNVCSGRGVCGIATNLCACDYGYHGINCESEYCWSKLPRDDYRRLLNLGFTNMTICTYATVEPGNGETQVVKLEIEGVESGFSGEPIADLVKFTTLTTLSIKDIPLSSTFLEALPALDKLKKLELVNTGLKGDLDWVDFPVLEILILSDNEFDSEIPPSLFEERTPVVQIIRLNNNLFTGTVPNIPDTTTEFDGSNTNFDDVPANWGTGKEDLVCIIELEDLCGDLYEGNRKDLVELCCKATVDVVEDNIRADEAQATVATVASVASVGIVAATVVTTAITTGATSIGGLVSATASSMGSIGGSGGAMATGAGGANPGMAQVVGFAGFVGGVIGPLSQKNSQGSVAGASSVARPFATGTVDWGVETPESAENSCEDGIVINRNFISNMLNFATQEEIKANKDLDGLQKFAKRAGIPEELMFVTTMASYAILNGAIIGLFLVLAVVLYCKSKDSVTMKSLMYKSLGIVVTILSYAFYALVLLAFWELGSDRCITVPSFIILAAVAIGLIGLFLLYVVKPIKKFPKDDYRKLVRYDEWLRPEFVAEQQQKEVLDTKLGVKKSDVHHTILHILYEDYKYECRMFWLLTFTHKIVTAILVIFGRELGQVLGLVAVQMVLLIAMVYFKPYTTKSMAVGYFFIEVSKVFILLSTIAFTESANLSKEVAKTWGYITLISIVITLIGYTLILIGIAYSAYKTKQSTKKAEDLNLDLNMEGAL